MGGVLRDDFGTGGDVSSDARRIAPHRTSGDAQGLSDRRSASAAADGSRATRFSARATRAITEFLWLPGAVVAAYAALGVLSIVIDASPPHWLLPIRTALSQVISKTAASALLSAIATGVVTVTSITFSVLLLAVQQAAGSMTPSVFDQFLRRRTNQLYLGMFVGLSLYAFLVLSSSGGTAVIGATIALALTVVAFVVLVVLIYSTVDQMRSTSVTQVIHDRALKARRAELAALLRTRRAPTRIDADRMIAVHSEQDGYVTTLDLDTIAAALPADAVGEVRLAVTLGEHVAFGQLLAVVVDDDDARRARVADAIRRALRLDRERDLDIDATFAVEELGNIAWTALSTAKQNPQTGRDAVDRLRDLAIRWLAADSADSEAPQRLPIVYADTDLDAVLDTLLATLVVCAESHQVESCAHVVGALADALEPMATERLQRLEPALMRTLATVETHPLTRPLERALHRLIDVLGEHERNDAVDAGCDLLQRMCDAAPTAGIAGTAG